MALFHGSDQGAFFQQGSGKTPHAPFRPEQIAEAGLHHAFLGHFRSPADAPMHRYPGKPDPLNFGEQGVRGAVIATIHGDGRVDRLRRDVASTEAMDITVVVDGCNSLDELADRVRASLADFAGVARITLAGTLEPSINLLLPDLYPAVARLQAVSFRLGQLHLAYDFASFAEDRTVRGQFVQDVLAAGLREDDQQAILVTGLRALDGRADLRVV